ncbi:C40 family peptidase [Mesobacillus campisalis]|uniref:C40 family peptidase n=1 Tax=Mesobacillus campisalis TaxID=1408103 RepID=UPI000AAFA073|nr:SH3 domain-containing C40 family peptidase [Mesobacillus campisalis]
MFKRILAALLLFTLVTTAAPSLEKASASGSLYIAKIDSGNLNVRKSASTKAAVVTKLKKNQQMTVHSQSKGWAHITANGKKGYVSSKYIAPKKSIATATAKKPAAKATTASFSTDYRSKAISVAKSNQGVKYLWGGSTPKGFDCSGLVSYSFKQAGKTLPRTAAEMYTKGTKVASLSPGDLLFYATAGGKKVTHVAIYIGNGQMVHATSSKGVTIDKMSNSYWKARYVGAKRI